MSQERLSGAVCRGDVRCDRFTWVFCFGWMALGASAFWPLPRVAPKAAQSQPPKVAHQEPTNLRGSAYFLRTTPSGLKNWRRLPNCELLRQGEDGRFH
jgi:hypothetical protein